MNPQANSVTLPAGGLTYVYAATEGGSVVISKPNFVQDLLVTNNAGNPSVIIGHSSSNVGSYDSDGALFPIIGGISVASASFTNTSFLNTGTTSLSNSFTLTSAALVVLASASSNNAPFVSVSAPFTVDNFASTSCCSTVVMAHADLQAGSYSFTVAYAACASPCTSDVTQMSIGVELYAFSSQTETKPSGILSDVPITISNVQSAPTPVPFQQMISFPSSQFSSAEDANLQNVEFFYSNGTIIPSWLESGNANNATSTTYWLKLSQSIPAGGTTTIFAGFAAQGTNLFDGINVGEAPALSPTYAQYDNGGNVFAFYDNFAGTNLSSQWSSLGSNGVSGSSSQISVNNQLTLVPTLGALYYQGTWVATNSASGVLSGPLVADASIAASQPVTNFARSACQQGCFETRFGFEDTMPSNLNEGNGVGLDIAQPSVLAISANQYDQVFVTLPTVTLNQFHVYSVAYGQNYTAFQLNYTSLTNPLTTDVPSPSSQMELFLETNYQQISSDIQWVRTRALPPNDQMPQVTIAGTGSTGTGGGTITPPKVDTASIIESTSIQLPAGSQLYIYGFATGGCCPTGDFQYGQFAGVNDLDGFRIAGLAVTPNNQNSYPSQTAYNTIGGVGVSGFASYNTTFQATSQSGPDISKTDSFTVSSPNSLVLVFAIGGGSQCQQLSGLTSLQTDANTGNLNPIITIAHTYLNPGTYSVTDTANQCAAGQDPNHAGNLLGVFVFTGTTQTNGSPIIYSVNTTLTSDVYCSDLTIDPGVTLTTNGFNIYCTGTVLNQGAIVAGRTPLEDFLNSYGGSGGGAQSNACNAASGHGFSTRAPGGQGNSVDHAPTQPGSTPSAPALTSSLIQSWYGGNMSSYLAGAGGQTVCGGISGGSGGYGIYIQGNQIVAGTISAQGTSGSGTCSGMGLSGSGGGGAIVIAYGSGGFTPGNYNVKGGLGVPSCDGLSVSGNGGDGQVLTYNYGTAPPILISGSAPGFSITSTPNILNIAPLATGESILTITSINNFTGQVNLLGSSSPGLSANLSSNLVTLNSVPATVNVTVSATNPGMYTLSITGSAGGTLPQTVTITVNVGSIPLSLTINGPATATTNSPTTFEAVVSGGVQPIGQVTWSAPGGTPTSGSGLSFTLSFSSPGVYAVSGSVTDANGTTAMGQATISVTGQTLSMTISGPTLGMTGNQLTFFSNPSGGQAPYSFAWVANGANPHTGSGSNFVTTFSSPGSFSVSATVTDSLGHSASASLIVTITGTFSVSISGPSIGSIGGPLTFSANTVSGTPPFTFQWTAIGGTPGSGSGQSFTVAFSAIGVHSVSLTAYDSSGQSASASMSVDITPPPLSVTISGPTTGVAGNSVLFASSAAGGIGPYTFKWTTTGNPSTGTGSNFATAFSSAGHYMITVKVTDVSGTTASNTITISISPPPLVLTIDWSGPAVVGMPATFGVTVMGGTTPYSTVQWSVNGANPSSGSGSSFTTVFNTQGSFTISASVNDAMGQSASNTVRVTVSAPVILSESFRDISNTPISQPLLGQQFSLVLQVENPDSVAHTYSLSVMQECNGSNGCVTQELPGWPNWLSFLRLPHQWDVSPRCEGSPANFIGELCGTFSQMVTIGPMSTAQLTFTFTDYWNWIPQFSSNGLIGQALMIAGQFFAAPGAILTALTFAQMAGVLRLGFFLLNENFHFKVLSGSVSFDEFDQAFGVPLVKELAFVASIVGALPAAQITLAGLASCIIGVGCLGLVLQVALIAATSYVYTQAFDPSPTYTEVVTPQPFTLNNGTLFIRLPAVSTAPPEWKALFNTVANLLSLQNATTISEARYFGAQAAGSQYYSTLQFQAMEKYSAASYQATATFESQFSSLLYQLPPLNSTNLAIADNYLTQNGLPQLEQQILSGLGLSGIITDETQGLLAFNATSMNEPPLAKSVDVWRQTLLEQTSLLEGSSQPAGEQLTISESFMDGSGKPLALDPGGNPALRVVEGNGVIHSTNPGTLFTVINVTNTGNTPIDSLLFNDTLPVDWQVSPAWTQSNGAIHVYIEGTNRTLLEITNQSQIVVTSANPEGLFLSISNITATTAASPLTMGESLIVSVKLAYGLKGTSQTMVSFPRFYANTITVNATSAAGFTGEGLIATASSAFKAYSKIAGDVNGDGKVDIQDLALVAYAWGSRPGDGRWNSAADVMDQGIIDIQDLAYVAFFFGSHA